MHHDTGAAPWALTFQLNALVAKQPIVAKALKEQADAIAARNKLMMDADADVEACFDALGHARVLRITSAGRFARAAGAGKH
jgi:hypothetical protein